MQVTWLHVSDCHIRGGDSYDRDVVLRALVKSVQNFRERGRTPDVVFATGDIAHSGKTHEYDLATQFFDALIEAAGVDRRRLFVIPGNHDVDRDLSVGLARLAGGLPVQLSPAAATLAYEARRGRLDSVRLTLTHETHKSFFGVYEHLEPPVQLWLHTAALLNSQRIEQEELYQHLKEASGWSEVEFQRLLDTCLDLHLLEGSA